MCTAIKCLPRSIWREIKSTRRKRGKYIKPIGNESVCVFFFSVISLNENSLKLQYSKYALLHFNFLQNSLTWTEFIAVSSFSCSELQGYWNMWNVLLLFHLSAIWIYYIFYILNVQLNLKRTQKYAQHRISITNQMCQIGEFLNGCRMHSSQDAKYGKKF